MIHPNVSVGPSTIHGLGLFAREPIPAGAVVWSIGPADRAYTPDELEALDPAQRDALLRWLFWCAARQCYVLCGDMALFTNHGTEPNLRCNGDGTLLLAARDIDAGEELTEDYREHANGPLPRFEWFHETNGHGAAPRLAALAEG